MGIRHGNSAQHASHNTEKALIRTAYKEIRNGSRTILRLTGGSVYGSTLFPGKVFYRLRSEHIVGDAVL